MRRLRDFGGGWKGGKGFRLSSSVRCTFAAQLGFVQALL